MKKNIENMSYNIKNEINNAIEKVSNIENKEISIYISITEDNINYPFDNEKHEVINMIKEVAMYTKGKFDNIEFSIDVINAKDSSMIFQIIDSITDKVDMKKTKIKVNCTNESKIENDDYSQIICTVNDIGEVKMNVSVHYIKDSIIDKINQMGREISKYDINGIIESIKVFYESNSKMNDEEFEKIIMANEFKKMHYEFQ